MNKNDISNKSKPTRPEWKGFLNYSLDKTDRAQIRDLIKDGINVWLWLQELIEEGFEVKLAYDFYSECFSVMVNCIDPAHPDAGYAVSARHNDLQVAAHTMMYFRTTFVSEDGAWLRPNEMTSEFDW